MFATKVVSSPYGPPARVKTMRPVSPAIAGVGDDWSVGRAVCGAVPVGARAPPGPQAVITSATDNAPTTDRMLSVRLTASEAAERWATADSPAHSSQPW
jgi:hypothetical protein